MSGQSLCERELNNDSRPGSRWWWMGNAVDKQNLTYQLEAFAKAGIGTLEITPIYGVQGNDSNEIAYLSPQWMEMLRYTLEEGRRLGIDIHMNNGTGWPFGGPDVTVEDAACRLVTNQYEVTGGQTTRQLITPSDPKRDPYARLERLMAFHKDKKSCKDITSFVKGDTLVWKAPKGEWTLIAAFCSKTGQRVKRAAPGGEGFVVDHFSKRAVSNYLSHFDKAFEQQPVTSDLVPVGNGDSTTSLFPKMFFNDSYEVYKADWTEGFFDVFAARRGYKLEEYLQEFLAEDEERSDITARVVADYRETLDELLLENFTMNWTSWAHGHGCGTRCQAHGSPANLIDIYAATDIPECEGFGLSSFAIRGLRHDSLTRPNDADLTMLKYASSAAHVSGKPFTSSETLTWLTEHFRTSLSQCKPEVDLMMVAGVNRVFFHGSTYSPVDAAWPGWKFYASVDMSPTNSIWRDAPAFFNYISRCQSFMQEGKPDNDFLLYLPVHDLWYEQPGRLLMFDIHGMAKRAPRFIDVVRRIEAAGYDADYISDKFILSLECNDGKIVTEGGTTYKSIIVPGARLMPVEVLGKLLSLAKDGAKVVFLDCYPEDVPGLEGLDERRKVFRKVLKDIQVLAENDKNNGGLHHVIFDKDCKRALKTAGGYPEEMKSEYGLSCIRRSNNEGYHYFISALTDKDIEAWMALGVDAQSAVFYNPIDGSCGKARIRHKDGKAEVYLQLLSGESVILKTFTDKDVDVALWRYRTSDKDTHVIPKDAEWKFEFVNSEPAVGEVPDSVLLGSWTDLEFEQSRTTMGTARYSVEFYIGKLGNANWELDLGDVRESARVRLNGKDVVTLWAVPYRCFIEDFLHEGRNLLEVEVTNLPANRIADMDRRGDNWRIFKEINMVDRNYKKTTYADWLPVESGLLGPVRIIRHD